MASKKDGLNYGQMPLPQGQRTYTKMKLNWSGLNRRQTVDTGVLSAESNISTAEAPYLTPSQKWRNLTDYENNHLQKYAHPISMFGFDGFLIVIYRGGSDNAELRIDYIELSDNGKSVKRVHTGYVAYRNEEGKITPKTVDSSTDSIQRCMVQFNVYENSVDVLDGVYVKKLLLFPDKVSMYMKIVTVSEKPTKSQYEQGIITDLDCMYCYLYYDNNKEYRKYYAWNYLQGDFEYIGKDNYFMTDALDVVVKKYYGDGYTQASGKYDDGYKRVESKYYNDGYRPARHSKFNDFYEKVENGTYTSGTYYERIGTYSPYTYTPVLLNEGDELKGLYVKKIGSASQYTPFTYYERSGEKYPYEYTPVTELKYGDNISEYYEKSLNSQYPIIQKSLYKRDIIDEKRCYVEVTGLKYGDDISSYYEKISEKDIDIIPYYTRSGEEGSYTYTDVGMIEYGDDVSDYYIHSYDYAPPPKSNKNVYWFNTYSSDEYSSKTYCYSEEAGGFIEAMPPAFPNLKYAVVHLSRLFGVDSDRVHVSGFNDYANWFLDTAYESNESNAWSSAAQANTKANGNFTGIAVYDNHVVCFKQDYMHEIYNNKNPFRLVDVYADGTIDNRSIQEVDGKLIFVSNNGVKVYTGSKPHDIGYQLGFDSFDVAVSGNDGRNYYLYVEDKDSNGYLFTYDTYIGQWSEQSVEDSICAFAYNKNGMYTLMGGNLCKMDTGQFEHEWSFETDMSTALTSSSTSSYQTVNIKHISKLQMLAYIKGSMKIYALYDNEVFDSEKSQLLYDTNGKTGMLPIRLKPRMTANYGYKLHFEGKGYVRLYEMELHITAGGELYV